MADAGIPVPADFAEGERLAFHSKVQAKYRDRISDLWEQFNGGLGGLLYRFTACAEHDDEFTACITKCGGSPPFPHRYYQERELFEFFATGQSAIECLCYSLYALGAMVQPSSFDLFTKRKPKKINPENTKDAYQNAFGGQSLTDALALVIGSAEYAAWTETRNILMHRAHPGRHFSIGGRGPAATWLALSIDSNTTSSRRHWLAQQVRKLLAEADAFVDGLP